MNPSPLATYLRKAGYSKRQRNLAVFARRYGIPRYELSRILRRQAEGRFYGHYRMICALTSGLEEELHTHLDPRDLFAPEPSPPRDG